LWVRSPGLGNFSPKLIEKILYSLHVYVGLTFRCIDEIIICVFFAYFGIRATFPSSIF
jgi:hypothetical protein